MLVLNRRIGEGIRISHPEKGSLDLTLEISSHGKTAAMSVEQGPLSTKECNLGSTFYVRAQSELIPGVNLCVLDSDNRGARLGFEAPDEYRIQRFELLTQGGASVPPLMMYLNETLF